VLPEKAQESFFASRFAWSIAADWQARHLGLGNREKKKDRGEQAACSPQVLKANFRFRS
jgi:hypothetical protein